MNSNLFHNILNVAIASVAALTAFLVTTGCAALPTGGLECTQSWVDPAWTALLVTGMGVTKSLINVARDGFGGLIKKQPPVE